MIELKSEYYLQTAKIHCQYARVCTILPDDTIPRKQAFDINSTTSDDLSYQWKVVRDTSCNQRIFLLQEMDCMAAKVLVPPEMWVSTWVYLPSFLWRFLLNFRPRPFLPNHLFVFFELLCTVLVNHDSYYKHHSGDNSLMTRELRLIYVVPISAASNVPYLKTMLM